MYGEAKGKYIQMHHGTICTGCAELYGHNLHNLAANPFTPEGNLMATCRISFYER